MKILRTVAAISALTLVACGGQRDTTGPRFVPSPIDIAARDTSPVRTDATSYQLVRGQGEYRAYAIATYRNDGPGPVYYPRCGWGSTAPMFGLTRTGPDSTAKLFAEFAFACVGGVPTGTIEVGQSVAVRVPLGSTDQLRMQPPLQPEHIVGLMRVELQLCANYTKESAYCTMLPRSKRQSNAFLVHY